MQDQALQALGLRPPAGSGTPAHHGAKALTGDPSYDLTLAYKTFGVDLDILQRLPGRSMLASDNQGNQWCLQQALERTLTVKLSKRRWIVAITSVSF